MKPRIPVAIGCSLSHTVASGGTRRLAALVALALAAHGCQQPRGEILDRLLIGEVMMHAELAANLRALALPGGRLSGTENAERAQRFVADKLRAYGLKNVRFEPFDMQCWVVHETTLTVLTDPPRTLEGAVALGRTISTPAGGVTARVVDVGEGSEADFAACGLALEGKFALVRDNHRQRGDKLRYASQYGAVGMIVMEPPGREPVIGNGHLHPRPEPVVAIRHDEDLLARLARGEQPRLRIELRTENWNCRPSNVVAELPGSGPLRRELVIIGAHLDSWHLGEGAIDNGNGAATVLEVARALARAGWQPRRTVRFVWFMAEELGLEGSEAYVRRHLAEMDRIVAVINVDMPGSPRTFGVHGHPEIEPFLKSLRADLAGYEVGQVVVDPKGDYSDHAPFMHQGVCTLALWGDVGPGGKHYHTAGDKYDVVDRRATIQSAAVLAVLVRRLADAPERPTVRRAPTPVQGK